MSDIMTDLIKHLTARISTCTNDFFARANDARLERSDAQAEYGKLLIWMLTVYLDSIGMTPEQMGQVVYTVAKARKKQQGGVQ